MNNRPGRTPLQLCCAPKIFSGRPDQPSMLQQEGWGEQRPFVTALPRAPHVYSMCPSNALETYPHSVWHFCGDWGAPFENIVFKGDSYSW
jgi:hypothetical protein